QPRVDHQGVPVLHQNMPHIGQFGRLARPLAVESRIGVGGRGVGLVAALLAVKVAFTVAARRRWLAAAALGTKALHAGPRLDQRYVEREVIVRQERLYRFLVEHRYNELLGNVPLDQALALLGEYSLISNL